jgi:hypothetical protein
MAGACVVNTDAHEAKRHIKARASESAGFLVRHRACSALKEIKRGDGWKVWLYGPGRRATWQVVLCR